jgi:hypothetical protein
MAGAHRGGGRREDRKEPQTTHFTNGGERRRISPPFRGDREIHEHHPDDVDHERRRRLIRAI